jgi:hypothetical protein
MKWWQDTELVRMLRVAGFETADAYGDLEGGE